MNSTDSLMLLARNLVTFGTLAKGLTYELLQALERQDLDASMQLSAQLLEIMDSGDSNTRIIRTFVNHRLNAQKVGGRSMKRATITTEIGEELRCSKCGEYWPADSEFFPPNGKGYLASWCRACKCDLQSARYFRLRAEAAAQGVAA